jgi:hypothetical protein
MINRIPTIVRNNTGFFVGSSGLFESAPANVARYQFNPVTLHPAGMLIEP